MTAPLEFPSAPASVDLQSEVDAGRRVRSRGVRSKGGRRARQAARPPRSLSAESYLELELYAAKLLARASRPALLEPRALVHEAVVRLLGREEELGDDRSFGPAMKRAMHDVFVEEARRARSLKYDRDALESRRNVVLDQLPAPSSQEADISVREAGVKLKAQDPKNARVIALRYFSGLTTEETAAALGCSVATIERKWRVLKRWLARELG